LGELEDDRALGVGTGAGLAAQDRRLDPLAIEQHPAAEALELTGRRDRPRLRAGDDQRQADVDKYDVAVGGAVPVAFLVEVRERGRELGRVGARWTGDGQLEGLARVAHLVEQLGLSLAAEPLASRGD